MIVYIVFDGPPSHEAGRFIEVETEDGRSVKAGEWVQNTFDRTHGYWRLGPFETEVKNEHNKLDIPAT